MNVLEYVGLYTGTMEKWERDQYSNEWEKRMKRL